MKRKKKEEKENMQKAVEKKKKNPKGFYGETLTITKTEGKKKWQRERICHLFYSFTSTEVKQLLSIFLFVSSYHPSIFNAFFLCAN